MADLTDQELYEAHLLLHRLWSASVGTSEYEKSAWVRLEYLLGKLIEKQTGDEQSGGWLAKIQNRLGPGIMEAIGRRARGSYGPFPCNVPPVDVPVKGERA